MSPEQLKVLQDCNKTSPKGHHSIGLANVNQRLRSYYGEEYGLLVDSIPGEGTIIDIVLPSSAINIEPSFFNLNYPEPYLCLRILHNNKKIPANKSWYFLTKISNFSKTV